MAKAAKTRARAQAPTSPTPNRRAPRKCRQCPDSPLLSECPHRFRGRRAATAAPHDATQPVVAAPDNALLTVAAAPEGSPLDTMEDTPAQPSDGEQQGLSSPAAPATTAGTAAPSVPATPEKRVYASDSNPIHGVIDGLGRGNEKTKMARTRALKLPYTDQATANKRFDVLLRDLVTRGEALAHRTSAWVYIAVHHPSARTSFLHFCSRKLRKEAPEEVQKIHKEVGKTMSLVKRADRVQGINYEREREEVLEKLKEAERAVAEAKAQAADAASDAAHWKAQAMQSAGSSP